MNLIEMTHSIKLLRILVYTEKYVKTLFKKVLIRKTISLIHTSSEVSQIYIITFALKTDIQIR